MNRCAKQSSTRVAASLASALLLGALSASAQTDKDKTENATGAPAPTEQQPRSGSYVPQPAAAAPAEGTPVMMGPTREVKLAEHTWFRFGFQVQAWFKAAQDRIVQFDGGDGGYALDFYCRRCRLFATGSVVKDITFNLLMEASNFGKADPVTGVKAFVAPQFLDAYGQVKFNNFISLSAGSILLPLTRNGLQPTTTYLSIDNANVDTTPILQGNSTVLRDLGMQANGFFLDDHLEYRLGVFQGTRAPAVTTGTGAGATTTQTAGHNPPRVVAMLSYNLWDTEKGYVNGGHYYGAKKVFGFMVNADYQILRKVDSPGPGFSKDAYMGLSAATFINYPLSGSANPKTGGDELVGLLQFGMYDGGGRSPVDPTSPGTYSAVLRQINLLAEAAYFNKAAQMSFFLKLEARKIAGYYADAVKASNNVQWAAIGLKYYVAPGNLFNFGLQYERVQFPDAPATAQNGTHNITFQTQMLLY